MIAFLGVTLARAVAAPVNANYTEVSPSCGICDFGKLSALSGFAGKPTANASVLKPLKAVLIQHPTATRGLNYCWSRWPVQESWA